MLQYIRDTPLLLFQYIFGYFGETIVEYLMSFIIVFNKYNLKSKDEIINELAYIYLSLIFWILFINGIIFTILFYFCKKYY